MILLLTMTQTVETQRMELISSELIRDISNFHNPPGAQ